MRRFIINKGTPLPGHKNMKFDSVYKKKSEANKRVEELENDARTEGTTVVSMKPLHLVYRDSTGLSRKTIKRLHL